MNRNGANALTPAVAKPNSKSLDIRYSAINNNLSFEKLSNGAYANTVTVVTSSGYSEVILSSLFVVGNGQLPDPIQIEPSLLGKEVFVNDGSGVRLVKVTDLLGIAEPVLLGDINEDGLVDGRDALHLMKYLAGEADISINLGNADMNQDGEVNDLDLVRLMKHLADTP